MMDRHWSSCPAQRRPTCDARFVDRLLECPWTWDCDGLCLKWSKDKPQDLRRSCWVAPRSSIFFASMNKSGLNQAALRSLSGVQNVEPTIHEVRLYFTQAPGQDLFGPWKQVND